MIWGWKTDLGDFAQAVADFERALPGFWWKVGTGSAGVYARCGVDGNGCQAELRKGVEAGDPLYDGFLCYTDGISLAEALRDCMRQALEYLNAGGGR